MIGADPPDTLAPLTIPVDTPIVATLVLPLVHVPPGVRLLSVVVKLAQKVVVPVMVLGIGFTVATAVAKQPPGIV